MSVEIDYFAWEENKYDFPRPHRFVKHAFKSRIKTGYLACQVIYQKGWSPWYSYELYRSDESRSISKLAYIAFDYHFLYDWDEFDISPDLSDKFEKLINKIPQYPGGLSHNIYPSYRSDWINAVVRVGSATQDYFDISPDGSNYAFYDFEDDHKLWNSLNNIIELCKPLAGEQDIHRKQVQATFEPFRLLFRKKVKHAKYQGKWSSPPLPDYPQWSDEYYYTDLDLLRTFKNENLSDDWKRQLDFKFYLSGFMRLLAFHNDENKLGAELIFLKIGETDFPNWDEDEQEALQNYFRALWEYILTYYPSLGIDAYTFVHGVGLAGADVTPYIEHWKQEFHRVEVSRHLACYVEVLFGQYVENGRGVIDKVPMSLRDWLRELGTGDYFLKQFMAYDGIRPFASEFADASETLDAFIDAGL